MEALWRKAVPPGDPVGAFLMRMSQLATPLRFSPPSRLQESAFMSLAVTFCHIKHHTRLPYLLIQHKVHRSCAPLF